MSRIRELVRSLDAQGVASPYLERLRSRVVAGARTRGGDGLEALQAEILAEMAASLGRAEDRVNEALLACELLERDLASLEARGGDASERRALVVEFNRQRDVAERRLWELTVQREAIGIRRHDVLEQHYPIPKRKAS